MTIYLDIVLLENLGMNYMILFTTGYLLKITRAEWSIRNTLVYIPNFTSEDTLTKESQDIYT